MAGIVSDEYPAGNEFEQDRSAERCASGQRTRTEDVDSEAIEEADRSSITLSLTSNSSSQRPRSPRPLSQHSYPSQNRRQHHHHHPHQKRPHSQNTINLQRGIQEEMYSDLRSNDDDLSDTVGSEFSCQSARRKAESTPATPTSSGRHHPMLSELRKAAYAHPTGTAQHKVRSFAIKKGRLVTKGNRYICRSPSSNSMISTASSSDSNISMAPAQPCKVLLLGASGVGKRALIHEFSSPDSTELFHSVDDDSDRTVSILLDGQESTMEFVDMSDREVDEYVAADQIDAYVVVYSVEDHKSFETAIDRLYEIRQEESKYVALILVANKTDLVRTRVVLEAEGRSAAKTYDCKYIEVSAAIDHRIDELLVGILKQIRLVQERKQKSKKRIGGHKSMVDSLDSCCLLRASRESVLAKLFRGDKQASKSCDNLYVL